MIITKEVESTLLMVYSLFENKPVKIFIGSNFRNDKKDEKLFSYIR
jgi:hypothetical protein